jgi:hypothetical protein
VSPPVESKGQVNFGAGVEESEEGSRRVEDPRLKHASQTHIDTQDQGDNQRQLEEDEGAVEEISALGVGRRVALDVVSD